MASDAWTKRRGGPSGVEPVTAGQLGPRDADLRLRAAVALGRPAPGTLVLVRGQEDLDVGVGRDGGADVTSLHDDAARTDQLSLHAEHQSMTRTAGTAETALTALVTSRDVTGRETSTPSMAIRGALGSVLHLSRGSPHRAAIVEASSKGTPS